MAELGDPLHHGHANEGEKQVDECESNTEIEDGEPVHANLRCVVAYNYSAA